MGSAERIAAEEAPGSATAGDPMQGRGRKARLSSGRGCPLLRRMSEPACPICDTTAVLSRGNLHECLTCGHEWRGDEPADEAPADRVVKDAFGKVLADGDIVAMVKDLKLKGSSEVLKVGTKSKPIRLVDGDHEISCKMNGIAIGLKACFVKKVNA